MRALSILTVAAFMLGTSTAHAAECNIADPKSSSGWLNFNIVVDEDYGLSFLNKRGQSLVYGHALGRAERAVSGNYSRAVDLACIEAKLLDDDLNSVGALLGTTADGSFFLIEEAKHGRHDAEVANLTGVRDKTPYVKAFSLAAGPTVGGGVSINIREGSRPTGERAMRDAIFGTQPQTTTLPAPPVDDPNGPNFNDLPNKEVRDPNTGHWHQGYMMKSPPGIEDRANWRFPSEYHYCVELSRQADRGKGTVDGGLRKGYIQVLALVGDPNFRDRPDLYRCVSSAAPFANVYMKEMEERKSKTLDDCKNRLQKNVKWCKVWFMN